MCYGTQIESAYIQLDRQIAGSLILRGDDFKGGDPLTNVFVLLTVTNSRYVEELEKVVAKLHNASLRQMTVHKLYNGGNTTLEFAVKEKPEPVRDPKGYLVNLAHRIEAAAESARSDRSQRFQRVEEMLERVSSPNGRNRSSNVDSLFEAILGNDDDPFGFGLGGRRRS